MLKRLSLLTVFVLGFAGPLWAQATSTINGRVVDQGEALLPGVTINVKNLETGATRNTVTNEQGVYSLPALDRGSYEVATELAGLSATPARLRRPA